MNIMVPVASKESAIRLCDAGADEIYIGIYDNIWIKKFGDFEEINRMSSFGKRANVTIQECYEIIQIVHQKKKKIYMAFNSGVYSKREVDYIISFIEKNNLDRADGFIASDLYLLSKLIDKSYNVILSTMAGVYNSDIIQFYYEMGIRRMIIPRDISIKDIKSMVEKFKDIEFETFIMRNGCKYSDANCMMYQFVSSVRWQLSTYFFLYNIMLKFLYTK